MKGRQRIEQNIVRTKRDMRAHLLDIGQYIGMAERNAFGFAFGAGREQNKRGIVRSRMAADGPGCDRPYDGARFIEDR